MDNRIRGRNEVERRQDDFVIRATADGEKGKVECGRAVRNGKGVARITERRERPLELLHARSHAPPAGAHGLGGGPHKLVLDSHVSERNTPGTFGLAHAIASRRLVACLTRAAGRAMSVTLTPRSAPDLSRTRRVSGTISTARHPFERQTFEL